jgi:hypothetical protein
VVLWRNYSFSHIFSLPRKESMFFIPLLRDLPGCSVEQVSQTEEAILITACATTSSACCPDCQQLSSQVHSSYTRSPRVLPSSGRVVHLLLRVRCFSLLFSPDFRERMILVASTGLARPINVEDEEMVSLSVPQFARLLFFQRHPVSVLR